MAAVFVLGASGVQIGTLLLSSEECPIHENYKNAIVKAKDNDTVVTGRSVGAPVRILKNPMSREYLKMERGGAEKMELEKFTLGALRKAVHDGDVKNGSLMAGQVASMVKEIRPISEILNELVKSYEDTGLDQRQARAVAAHAGVHDDALDPGAHARAVDRKSVV